ncbi:MAG: phosphoenolpyruvate--protein phosphotransferase [Candidatus Eisenbacteria bacterium]|nr:phosphoenolpyruvate--protein phosphotransferase [Candidatus Eisenbacteria bacterium]
MPKKRKSKRIRLVGMGASPGLAQGPARILVSRQQHVPRRTVSLQEVGAEIRRFRTALRRARAEIREMRERLGRGVEDPGDQILASHQMILQDRELNREIVLAIKRERMDAAYVVRRALLAKARYFESLPSEFFRSRAADIEDVERRLLSHLLGTGPATVAQVPAGSVVVASEIPPSETAALDRERVAALVTEHGTLTSHVTIMARSRGVPAVIGLGEAVKEIPEEETLLVDGERGLVIVAPNESDLRHYREREASEARVATLIAGSEQLPGEMRDGVRVELLANVERPEDASPALAAGAEGIGLFRTEFFFMDATRFPPEDAQRAAYEEVARAFAGRPVVIRTMDLGGDKYAALMGVPHEANPFLGLRGIRFCLAHPELFLVQLRAILRAAQQGNVRILLPMVSQLGELRAARDWIDQAAEHLRREGVAVPTSVAVGVMIETPSAVLMSDVLAREVDFFSIGSNDLIQYSLAVDRGNERIAELYDALDPAVLRAIDLTVRNAQASEIPVASCGEMSGELPGLLLLIGLGVRQLSVAPLLVPRVKGLLRRLPGARLTDLAQACLQAGDRREVWERVRQGLSEFPELHFEQRDGRWICQWRPPAGGGGER